MLASFDVPLAERRISRIHFWCITLGLPSNRKLLLERHPPRGVVIDITSGWPSEPPVPAPQKGSHANALEREVVHQREAFDCDRAQAKRRGAYCGSTAAHGCIRIDRCLDGHFVGANSDIGEDEAERVCTGRLQNQLCRQIKAARFGQQPLRLISLSRLPLDILTLDDPTLLFPRSRDPFAECCEFRRCRWSVSALGASGLPEVAIFSS